MTDQELRQLIEATAIAQATNTKQIENNAKAIAELTKRAAISDLRIDNLTRSISSLVATQELVLDKIEGVVNELRHIVRNQ